MGERQTLNRSVSLSGYRHPAILFKGELSQSAGFPVGRPGRESIGSAKK